MGRIEADAREALLRRRRSLAQAVPARPHDPAARWHDYEAHPTPLSDGARGELADIDAALARIREGRYGVCVACGGPMGLQRLRAIPEARYCLGCSGHAPVE
jgi:DnaK suppressor protein